MNDYQKAKLYREALKQIEAKLSGIASDDLTRAECQILAIVSATKKKAGLQ